MHCNVIVGVVFIPAGVDSRVFWRSVGHVQSACDDAGSWLSFNAEENIQNMPVMSENQAFY